MDQPLVNLNVNPNSIEETPQVLPPEQPFYLSSSNTNTPNEKPIKSQQNKANHSSQINFQHNDLPQNEGVLNIQPANNIDKFSEITHGRISHPNEKTFNILVPPKRCLKCCPLFVFFCGLFLISFPFIIRQYFLIFVYGILGFCILLVDLILCFKFAINVSFILGPNNLTIVKKSFCSKKTFIYNRGELLRIDYFTEYVNGVVNQIIKSDAILPNGSSVPILRMGRVDSTIGFDLFFDIINKHIQTKMKV